MIRHWPAVSVLLLVAAAGARADDRLSLGAAAIAPFRQSLQTALQEGMTRGPVEAIGVCRVQAPDLALAASLGGVKVGRSSHRLRNPANAPAPWMGRVLEDYLESPAGREHRAVDLGNGRWGYAEPILTQPLCLACHGEAIAPEIAARLRELYPADQATGFKAGELRGIFWAEFDAGP